MVTLLIAVPRASKLPRIPGLKLMSPSIVIPLPLLQLMRRASRDHRLAWWGWMTLTGVAVAMIIGCALMHDRARDRLAQAKTKLELAHAAKSQRAAMITTLDVDFTQSMGRPPSTARVVQELKQASSLAGATLVSIQSQEHPAAIDQLGMLELTVTLKGSYASDKQVLAHVIERFPYATVPRMRLRRGQATSDVEATVTLVFWGVPIGAISETRR